MRVTLAKLSLRLALIAVGLTKARVPLFFRATEYSPLTQRTDAIHVTVGGGRIAMHEYTTDVREARHTVKAFETLEAFIRAFVAQRIDWACTTYMATARKDTLGELKAGKFEDIIAARKEYENTLVNRLDRFLRGFMFSFLSRYSRS
jgi:hypothetical protein